MYDALDADRSDLEVYAAIIEELGARCVLDVGCGTGTVALLLADRGLEVTGVDPAEVSFDVARAKTGAERVRWIHGDAASLPGLVVDVATPATLLRPSSIRRTGRERCAASFDALRPRRESELIVVHRENHRGDAVVQEAIRAI